MGAWGPLAFDNDGANDWAYDLANIDNLTLVEGAFDAVDEAGADYLEQDAACNALAACEVLARLRGRPGHQNGYTEKVDRWVRAHAVRPSPELLARAEAVIDRILGPESELRELWEEGDAAPWRAAVEDLRQRVKG